MRIGFLLPRFSLTPIGGFKVVYEYGARLAARGHQVELIHTRRLEGAAGGAAQNLLWPVAKRRELSRGFWFPDWAPAHMRFAAHIDRVLAEPRDALVATGWRTAAPVAAAAGARRTYYLIQHHEIWDGPADAVNDTWRLPLHKIVIARWLAEVGRELGVGDAISYIPNGLDFQRFRLLTPPAARDPHHVGMLYHPAAWKGAPEGLAALAAARAAVPDLTATLFGTVEAAALPPLFPWVRYERLPTPPALEALYNRCAIFLHPSHAEGWPLPPAEAMSAGAALVAFANGGVSDYAADGETALLASVGDVPALAGRLVRLCRDSAERIRLAEAGRLAIQRYTWERAVNAMEAALAEARPPRG